MIIWWSGLLFVVPYPQRKAIVLSAPAIPPSRPPVCVRSRHMVLLLPLLPLLPQQAPTWAMDAVRSVQALLEQKALPGQLVV